MASTTLPAQESRQQLHDIIRKDVSFETKARDALDVCADHLDVDHGYLTRIDRETDHWEVLVTTDTVGGRTPPGHEHDLTDTYCRKTIDEETHLAFHDAPNQGWAADPALESRGHRSYLGIPLVLDDSVYGTICFVAEEPRSAAFADTEIMFAEHLTRLLERELARDHVETELANQSNLTTVLNRVLRHNLRNDISVIRGYTEIIAEQLDDDSPVDTILSHIDDLIEMSEKARELEQIISANSERQYAEVSALAENVADTVRDQYPEASIAVEYDDTIHAGVLPNFDRALEELLENAVKHSDDSPVVTVTIETTPQAVEIRISDDGPGLPESEAAVLESEAETPLTHGSGLGLWLAHWIVSSHDGAIDPTVTENGTRLTVSIPRASTVGVRQQLTELTRARDKYEAAFEEATDAITIIDDEGRILDANAATGDTYGMEPQELIGRSLTEFFPAEFTFETAWRDSRDAGVDRETIVTPDGRERVLEYSGTPDIVPGQHLFVSRDITERKEREAELTRKTEAMEKAPVGISITDPSRPDNPMIYVNERFRELTGYDDDEIIGRNCRFLQGPGTDPETVATIRDAIDAEEPVSTEIRNYRKDGTMFWNHLMIAPVRDEDGDVINWVGFQNEITDRIERKNRLEVAETVFQNTQDALFVIDVTADNEFAIQRVNTVYEGLTGLSNADIAGQAPSDVVGDEIGRDIESQYRECVERRETIEYVEEIPVDGEHREWVTKLTPVVDEGRVVKLIGAMRDVTSTQHV